MAKAFRQCAAEVKIARSFGRGGRAIRGHRPPPRLPNPPAHLQRGEHHPDFLPVADGATEREDNWNTNQTQGRDIVRKTKTWPRSGVRGLGLLPMHIAERINLRCWSSTRASNHRVRTDESGRRSRNPFVSPHSSVQFPSVFVPKRVSAASGEPQLGRGCRAWDREPSRTTRRLMTARCFTATVAQIPHLWPP